MMISSTFTALFDMMQANIGKGCVNPVRKSIQSSVSIGVWVMVWILVAIFVDGAAFLLLRSPLYQNQALWLMSRANAVAAYQIFTLVTILGLILSHPQNKQSWKQSKFILPWHQALIPTFLMLMGFHMLFSIGDPKSGVAWYTLFLPLTSVYTPFAMLLGSISIGLLIIVIISTMWRGKGRNWLKIHRISPLIWWLVFAHSLLAGTDVHVLLPVYVVTGILVVGTMIWRYGVIPTHHDPHPFMISIKWGGLALVGLMALSPLAMVPPATTTSVSVQVKQDKQTVQQLKQQNQQAKQQLQQAELHL